MVGGSGYGQEGNICSEGLIWSGGLRPAHSHINLVIQIESWSDSRRDDQFQKQTSTSQELGLKGKWAINRGRMGSLLSGMLAVVPGA